MERLPSMHNAFDLMGSTPKPGIVPHTYDSHAQETEMEGSEAQGFPAH